MKELEKEQIKFEYMKMLYEECLNRITQLINSFQEYNYLNISTDNITLEKFNIYFVLFYYLIRLHLFDSLKYDDVQIRNIQEIYFSLVEHYHTFMMKKTFKEDYNEQEAVKYLNMFDNFCEYSDIVFNSSDKTLLSYISTPCMISHYFIKNQVCLIEPNINIIPDDDEFQKLFIIVSKIVSETNFYKNIDNIIELFLRKYN